MSKFCIYHGIDLDGWLSAAITRLIEEDVILLPYSYGSPIPFIPPDSDIVICDVAFPMEKMQELADAAHSFTWIDHHTPTIQNFREFSKTHDTSKWITKLANDGELIGACELTWKHFRPDLPIPRGVELIGMFDSFRHKGTMDENVAMTFNLGAQAKANDPYSAAFFIGATGADIDQIIRNGMAIYQYKKMQMLENYRSAMVATIQGYRFLMSNSVYFNPPNYGIDYHQDEFDGAGSFYFDGKIWHMSLYSDDVDCAKICKTFGGGGHKGAAGCEPSNEIILKLITERVL